MKKYMQELIDEVKKDFPTVVLEEVYEGHITELDEKRAWVDLEDVYSQEEFMAEIKLDLFPVDNINYPLQLGTIFYIYLGYYKVDGKKENFQLIRLNQKVWTEEMLTQIKKEAAELFKGLNIQEAKIAD